MGRGDGSGDGGATPERHQDGQQDILFWNPGREGEGDNGDAHAPGERTPGVDGPGGATAAV